MTADTPLADTLALLHLACPVCGRSLACTPADLRVYAAIGPPGCCGQLLALPVAGPPPIAPRWARRRPARPGAGAEVRRAAPVHGPDLCAGLVDISADGVGVRLDAPVLPGEAVTVTFKRPGAARPVVAGGVAAWCRPAAGGFYLAGVRLDRPLSEAEVAALAR